MGRFLGSAAMLLVITSAPLIGQEAKITSNMISASMSIRGQAISIERDLTVQASLNSGNYEVAKSCPPACITPLSVEAGVQTSGELEVIQFLETKVAASKGLLLDTRDQNWFSNGTIPGAVNIPVAALQPNNPYRNEILGALGGVKSGDTWDFSRATELMIFGDGPASDQGTRVIKELRAAGYPADKLNYYRGGVQLWTLMGLTIKGQNS